MRRATAAKASIWSGDWVQTGAQAGTNRVAQLNMCKIAIKTMIEGTIGLAPPITDAHRPLAQVRAHGRETDADWNERPLLTHCVVKLLLVVEHLLRHGVRKKALAAHRDLFGIFDAAERFAVLETVTGLDGNCNLEGVVKAARATPGLRSNRGKGRFCLRAALQQV
jgi:hypothetical protein